MNNLLSYCGLVDSRISASEKDLPVVLSPNSPNTESFEISKELGHADMP